VAQEKHLTMRNAYLYLCFIAGIFISTNIQAQVTANFSVNYSIPNCAPSLVTFVNTSTGPGTLSYQWNFGVIGGVNSTQQNPSTTYLTCGTYNATLTVTSSNGQSNSITKQVTINCIPDANFSTPANVGCAPVTTSFQSTSVIGGGAITSYVWDFGDGIAGSGSNPSHTYINPGCKTVTLVITDANGCIDDTTITNAVCPVPPPLADFTSTPSVACAAPLSISYTAVNPGSAGPYTYAWTFQGGVPATSSSPNPTVNYNTPGAYYAQLIVTSPNGCADTIKKSNYVIIGLNVADFTISATSGCAPLTVYCAGPSNSQTIGGFWTAVGGISATPTAIDNLITYNTPGTYQICLTLNFPGNCTATNCTTVVVGAVPTAAFSVSGLQNVCQPPLNNVHYTNQSIGTGLTYQWSFPGGTPSSSTAANPPNINYTTCGVYGASLIVTNNQGCSDTMVMDSIVHIDCPIASFTASAIKGCIPFDVTFNSTASFGFPVSWEWNFGDVGNGNLVQSTQQNPTHTYTSVGCFNVRLIITNALGCKDTIKYFNFICCGTQPVVDFSASPLVTCIGQPITFTNLSTGVSPLTNYMWDFNGVPISTMSTLKNPTYSYTDTGFFDVILIACNNGCCDTMIKPNYVYINPPLAKITVDKSCQNIFSVTLHGETSIGADTYSWNIPGGMPSSSTSSSVAVSFPTTGTYTASLTVTNIASGCSNTSTVTIQIKDVEADFSITPTSGCAPFNFCINNLSVDANTYQWNISNSVTGVSYFFGTSANPCPTLQYPGIYNARLIATDVNGCKDTMFKPLYLTVYGMTVNFTATPTTGCAPLTVHFNDISTSPTSVAVGWSWDFGDPSSGAANFSSLQNPTHTYNSGGYYAVTLAVTDNHGCVNVKTTNSNFITAGKPSADFIAGDSSVCLGTPICFINTTTSAIGSVTYNWNFGDGVGTSTVTTPCYTYSDTGWYSVTLYAQDWWGCKDTAVKNHYIHIGAPYTNFTADTTNSICPPLQVNFQNLSLGWDSTSQFFWDFGDGATSTAVNPFHIYTVAGQFDVTLTLTTADGCSSTIVFNDYINITGPSAIVNVTPTFGCLPFPVCFNAVSSNTAIYIWDFGNGSVDLSNTDTVCYTYPNEGIYFPQVILNNGNGCVYSVPLDTITVSVVHAGFTISGNDFCNSGTVAFTDTSHAIVPITTWNWNFGDAASGALNTSTLQNPTHTYSSPGNYIVTLTAGDALSCSAIFSDTIIVHQLPDAQFNINPNPVCPGTTVNFNSTSTSVDAITTYQWNFGDGASGILNTSTLQNPSHIFNSSGVYNVKLKVITSFGCVDSLIQNVTVNVPPTANAGPDVAICNFNTTQLTGSGGLTYSWSPAAGLSASNISNPIASPSVTTTFSLTVADAIGCTGADNVVVNVNQLPNVNAGLDVSVCLNLSTILTASGATNYTWSPLAGLSATNLASVTASPTITTQYIAVGTDGNGCVNKDSVIVTVNPLPIADAGLDASICKNDSTQLNGAGGISFSWAPAASLNNSGIANPNSYPQSTTTYTLVVTDANGCTDNDAVTVTVNSLPNANAGPDQDICINFTTQLIATGGVGYSWNPGSTLSDSLIANPIASPLTSTTYSVIVTGANGCKASDDMTVTIHNNPIISAGPDATICYNSSTTLNATGGATYNWTPITALNNAGIANPVANPTTTTTYVVQGISQWGCIAFDTVIVNVLAPPVANAGNDTAVCYGLSTTLNGAGGVSYLWSPAGSLNNSSLQNPIATPLSTTTYTLIVTDANGCTDDDVMTVTINSLPVVSAGPDHILCLGDSYQLNASGAVSYQWSPSTGLNNAAVVNPITNTTVTTNYIVTGADNIGCQNSDSVLITLIYPFTAVVSPEADVCEGSQIQLNASGGVLYSWSPALGLDNANIPNPTAYGLQTTNYQVIVSDGLCFQDTAYVLVTVHPLPAVYAGPDQIILAGDQVDLIATGTGTTYLWNPIDGVACPDCKMTTAAPIITTTYTVIATNDFGCSISDDVVIKVGCTDDVVYIPNAFSPNADGNNDVLYVRSKGLKTLNYMRIYDRWGTKIFETNDLNVGWDGTVNGKIAMPGVFVYYMEGACANGQKVELQGNITLVR